MNTFATLTSVLSVVLGVTVSALKLGSFDSVLLDMATIWLLGSVVVCRMFGAEFWREIDFPLSHIWRRAKEDALPKTSALEKLLTTGACILIIAYMCTFLI